MRGDSEVDNLISQCLELPVLVEHNLMLLEQAHDATETCNLISSKTFNGMPVHVIKAMFSKTNSFKVSF